MIIALLDPPAPDGNAFLQFWLIIILLTAAIAPWITIWIRSRKQIKRERATDYGEAATTKSPTRRFNHDLAEDRHKTVTDRLAQHDQQIAALSTQLNRSIQDFERTVGNFEGTLEQVNKTMQMILEKEMNR